MRAMVMAVLSVGMVGATGCAAKGQAQALHRVQSDVALLEQRVNQLERASLQQGAASLPGAGSLARPFNSCQCGIEEADALRKLRSYTMTLTGYW